MKAPKKPSKASKPVKQTPLQLIRQAKRILLPVKCNPHNEVEYLLRMTHFGMLLGQLPLEFRHIVVDGEVLRGLLESFASLSRHKECLVCIFQSCAGIADEAVQLVLKQQLLPLLEVVLEINPIDTGLQLASVALMREFFKHFPKKLKQKQFDTINRLLKIIARESSTSGHLAEETLKLLEEPPSPYYESY